MSHKETGGPAFPVTLPNGERYEGHLLQDGMTLRDYFAAKAMQGLLAQSMGTATGSDVAYGATYAYQMADAMLAERAK